MMKLSVLVAAWVLTAAPADGPALRVEQLAWLAGCWEVADEATRSVEHWTTPDGGTMLGVSRTVRGERTVSYEFLRIWRDEQGDVYYTARPSGQAEASFKLVRLGAREAVFENPGHDFPQRITYRVRDDGSLFARVENIAPDSQRVIEFPMRRASCDGR